MQTSKQITKKVSKSAFFLIVIVIKVLKNINLVIAPDGLSLRM